MQKRRQFLGLIAAVSFIPAVAMAAKPEDVFKGKIMITKDRLPSRFPSGAAFIAAVQKARIDRVWPKEEEGNDKATWVLEYIAFFAAPLNDNEVKVKFWEISGGEQRYVAGDEQFTRDRSTRIFSANITLAKPEFETNKKYLMTMEVRSRVVASTTFWLRGKGPNYSGKVEFSDEETKGK